MSDTERRIEELELRAAESALIANLTTNREVRSYNSRLAEELIQIARDLRTRLIHS